MKLLVRVQGRAFQVEIERRTDAWALVVDGKHFPVDVSHLGDPSLLTMLVGGRSVLAHTRVADRRRGLYDVSIGGRYRRLEVLDPLAAATQEARRGAKNPAGTTPRGYSLTAGSETVHARCGCGVAPALLALCNHLRIFARLPAEHACRSKDRGLASAWASVREPAP